MKATKRLYGNCIALGPDGGMLFRCDDEKMNWYLDRGLAEEVSFNPPVIKLTFNPKGKGNRNDEYMLAPRDNRCVVCGTHDELTRHHVVPSCYRRAFPEALRRHDAYDVLMICIDCHDKYEAVALVLKRGLADKYGAPFEASFDPDFMRALRAAVAMRRHAANIPPAKQALLIDTIKAYAGSFSDEAIDGLLSRFSVRPNFTKHGKKVVGQVEDIDGFVRMWRAHFVKHAKPKFLPPGWKLDYRRPG